MNRKTIALILIMMGMLLVGMVGYTAAQEDATPEPQPVMETESQSSPIATGDFVGADECSACHRGESRDHELSVHVTTLSTDNILGDFDQDADSRVVQFPGEDAPRPFNRGDIAYAVGSGQHIQRYLYQIAEGQYRVFPAQWDVVNQIWEPFSTVTEWDAPAYDWSVSCAGCHTTGFDGSNWIDAGVTCESCHGAGAEHVALANELPRRAEGEELQAVRDSISLSPGADACATCHSNPHGLQLPTGHGLEKNMQYDEWLASAHSQALTALDGIADADESCLTCHSADYVWTNKQIENLGEEAGYTPITLETAQFGVTCSSCHNPHLVESDNFMIAETEALCASCHASTPDDLYHPVDQIFAGLPLVENVEGSPSSHFTAEDGPTCNSCHVNQIPTQYAGMRMSHTLAPVVPGMLDGVDSCSGCHSDISPDALGDFMLNQQHKVAENLVMVQQAINADSPAWVQNVAAVVEYDGSYGVHNTAYINQLLDAAQVELGLIDFHPANQMIPAQSPDECLECHQEAHRDWAASPHANASQNELFLETYAAQGRPAYCMSCHASGYNPNTGTYAFEGVVCTTCHRPVNEGAEHPPAPLTPGDSSALCGTCHSGAHAPSYNEWLVSDHQSAGIDCVDCHTPHNNGLVLGDVNTTCGDCHEAALHDEVHMSADLTCVDCHMEIETAEDGIHVVSTGHTMHIDPGVCSDCHGDIHALTLDETSGQLVDTSETEVLRAEIETLREEADENRNTGVIGGALGMLLVAIVIYVIVRLRRLL